MVAADLAAALEAGGQLDFSRNPDCPVLRCSPGADHLVSRLAAEAARADLRRVLGQAAAYRRALLRLATLDPTVDPFSYQRAAAEAEAVADTIPPAVAEAVRQTLGADAMGVRTQRDASSWVVSHDARAIRQYGNKRPDASAGVVASASLDPVTVLEVLGEHPNPHDLACLRFDVLAAVREIERGISTGRLPLRRLVRGRPLADWLDLGDLARLLRAQT